MPRQANSHLQLVTDELAHLGRQIRDIADEQLPRITDAAQRTGQSVARASSAAGREAARQLRAVPPVIGEKAASLRKSPVLTRSLRLAASRPALAVAGGLIVASAGIALWRMARRRKEDSPEASKSQSAHTTQPRRKARRK